MKQVTKSTPVTPTSGSFDALVGDWHNGSLHSEKASWNEEPLSMLIQAEVEQEKTIAATIVASLKLNKRK